MKKTIAALGALALPLAIATGASAEPFKVGYSVWVGYGPFFVAQEKGFFDEEGVEVELINIEDPKVRFAALAAGRIDGLATTVDTVPLYLKPDIAYRYVFAVDDSVGGDGVVARNEIKTIADLEGKKVAFNNGTVSQFYINVLLERAGLTEDDIEAVQMSQGDAGSAFVAGHVDAAVTWEPWLTRGAEAEHGKILADTSTEPGLVTDVFVVPEAALTDRKSDVEAIYRAWVKAVTFVDENPDEAYPIMAEGVGGWLDDPAVFAETLEKVSYFDGEENKAFFGTAEDPGPLLDTIKNALDVWTKFDRLQVDVTPKELVDFSIVNQ